MKTSTHKVVTEFEEGRPIHYLSTHSELFDRSRLDGPWGTVVVVTTARTERGVAQNAPEFIDEGAWSDWLHDQGCLLKDGGQLVTRVP